MDTGLELSNRSTIQSCLLSGLREHVHECQSGYLSGIILPSPRLSPAFSGDYQRTPTTPNLQLSTLRFPFLSYGPSLTFGIFGILSLTGMASMTSLHHYIRNSYI